MQADLTELLATHDTRPDGLLPLLHALQERLRHIPPEAVPRIAEHFNLSRAEVHGVISYYPFFRSHPPGRHVLQVCAAEACQACGGAALMAHAQQMCGVAAHATRADGALTLEPVYCLGLCAVAPAVQLDDELFARMTPAKLDRLAARWESQS